MKMYNKTSSAWLFKHYLPVRMFNQTTKGLGLVIYQFVLLYSTIG